MPFNASAYAQQRPDLVGNWQRYQSGALTGTPDEHLNSYYGQFPSFEAFLKADYDSNPANALAAPTLPTVAAPTAPAIDVNSLVDNANTGAATGLTTVNNAVGNGTTVPPGGNFASAATGVQTGGYNSAGATSQVSTGAKTNETTSAGGQTQNTSNTGNQVQNTSNVGTSTGTTTGTTNNVGAQTQASNTSTAGSTAGNRTVTAPFDISGLVGSQLPMIGATDAARSAFLADFMANGGTGFKSQTDQAIRSSLSGPSKAGIGESAAARAAGYGAAQVARENGGQRLQAAQMLGQPTGAVTAANSLAPLYGESTGATTQGQTRTDGTTASTNLSNTAGTTNATNTNTGTSTGSFDNNTASTGTNWANQLAQGFDINSLVGSENTAGTAYGASGSTNAGTAPTGQPVKTGGCVVCSAYSSLRLMHPGAIRRAVKWKLSRADDYALAVDGYMLYGPTLARWVLKSKTFRRAFRPVARAILYHEVHLSAPTRLKKRLLPLVTHELFDLLSRPVGLLSRALGLDTGVRCQVVHRLLRDNNLDFQL